MRGTFYQFVVCLCRSDYLLKRAVLYWDLFLTAVEKQCYADLWRHHQMEIFSALLVLSKGNSLVTREFTSQRPVTRSFDAFFDLPLNTRLSIQSRRRWYEPPTHSLWRHCNIKFCEKTRWVVHTFFMCLFMNTVNKTLYMLHVDFSFLTSSPNYLTEHIEAEAKWPPFSTAFSWLKMYEFRLRFHWKLFPGVQLTIFHHWFR